MQKIKFGNMLQRKAGILVHGCNAQGVMGSGIAGQIRMQYPQVFEDYRHDYDKKGLQLGEVIFTDIDSGQGLYVASAITQDRYGQDGKKYVSYKAVHDAFIVIAQEAADRGLSVHYPQIGAGLAGGDWATIQTCIDAAFARVERDHGEIERTLWIFE